MTDLLDSLYAPTTSSFYKSPKRLSKTTFGDDAERWRVMDIWIRSREVRFEHHWPAHNFVSEQDPAHFGVLVLAFVRYSLRGKKGKRRQMTQVLLEVIYSRDEKGNTPTCLVTESMSRAYRSCSVRTPAKHSYKYIQDLNGQVSKVRLDS